jgi:aryl-alcohol dehydrogenase-like predicted oxidoreductase
MTTRSAVARRRVRLGNSDLEVYPLCLGGNVFDWTVDEQGSFAVLDAYVDAGGNFLDTADTYSRWAAGNRGGESETVIGRWLARRGRREDVVLASKVGRNGGLSADNMRARLDASLRRLGTDHLDLYYAHADDPDTPLEETLSTFDAFVREGKIRYPAASRYSAARLQAAMETSTREGLAPFIALQTHYNLVERGGYEDELAAVCATYNLPCLPFYSLASGFLTGKYRPGGALPNDPTRREEIESYLGRRGSAVLAELDALAGKHDVSVAAIALAWLRDQPTVAAPVASATSPEQLTELLNFIDVRLNADERRRLDDASRTAPGPPS